MKSSHSNLKSSSQESPLIKKIPKELSAKFPIFHILVTVAKVFLLNEFEIAALGNILDNVNWKYEELILPGEASYLSTEFPLSLNLDLSDDCKRFIIYLLLIAFSVKQFLNEPSEFEKIKVYCEKICHSLPILFNRWIRSTNHKYNLAEMNKKFKTLSKKDFGEDTQNIKDYNVIVDSIMSLTGSYASKKTFETPSMSDIPNRQNTFTFNPEMYATSYESQIPLLTTEKSEIQMPSFSKMPSKAFEPGMSNDLIKIPTVVNKPIGLFNRSFSGEFTYQNPMFQQNKSKDEFDYSQAAKKFKTNNGYLRNDSFYNILNMPNLISSNSQYKPNTDYDVDNLNIPLPQLGKQNSNVSQGPDDLPSFSRFNSTFSMLDK